MRLEDLARRADEPTRRGFLAGAAAGLLNVNVFSLLGGRALAQEPAAEAIPLHNATARRVIYLYMNGGMSQLDTFDPKPGTENQGPVEAIASRADGVQVSSYLPEVARHMDKVALIRSMQSTQGAHEQGRYFLHTSYELRGTIRHPSLGAWLDRMAGPINRTLPGHVAIGNGAQMASAGFLEPQHAPLPIGDPSSGLQNSRRPEGVSAEVFDRRMERLRELNEGFAKEHGNKAVRAYAGAYEAAVRLMSSRDLQAFDIAQEPEAFRDAYGRTQFGQGCLLARRLVEHDVRFVEVALNGWDTHNDNFDALEEDLCPVLDRALSALLADLDARGLLEETLVVLATEFGRTPRVNERAGRDHYPKAFSCLLAGAGVRGGTVYGATDPDGLEIVEKPVTVPDFNATIAWALGLPLDHPTYSSSGRPFTVADKGRPVTELFA